MKLYMMKGLPASGKSTKRREMLADPSLGPLTYVNKDDIRIGQGIQAGEFKREKEVIQLEQKIILEVLQAGTHSLIVDNTHNHPKYVQKYTDLAREYGYEFELIDFSHVSLEECLRRDALRQGRERVGETIIRRMWEQSGKDT